MKVAVFAVAVFTSIAALAQQSSSPSAGSVYLQPPEPPGFGAWVSDGVRVTAADDFLFQQETSVSIITWWGYDNIPGRPDHFTLRIFSDQNGLPGPGLLDLAPSDIMKVSDGVDFAYSVVLPAPFMADAGQRYWLSVANPPYPWWAWRISSRGQPGQISYRADDGPWIRSFSPDLAFGLNIVPEPATTSMLLMGIAGLVGAGIRRWYLIPRCRT